MSRINKIVLLIILTAGVILLFSPIPHILNSDANCLPCDPNLLPSQCPKCPRKGDIEWGSSLAYTWYKSIYRKDRPVYTSGPMPADVIRVTDVSILQNQNFSSSDELIITAVGNDYFSQHFRKVKQQQDSDTTKTEYSFTYPPHIQELSMTLFFDNVSQTISTKERSRILLSPQKFRVPADQALSQAVKLGLISCQSYATQAEFDPVNLRLIWRVSRGTGCPPLTSKNQGVIVSVAIDAETGQVSSLEKNEPKQSF